MTIALGVLVSGSGSNLKAIMDRVDDGSLDADIRVVIANNPDALGLERAREALIDIWARHPNFPLNGKTPREQAEAHYAREVAHAHKGEEG